MTTKKPRKSLGDALANNFVYGDNAPIPAAEPIVEQVEPNVKPVATAETSAPVTPQPPTSLMSRLMQNTPEKESTVRLTVDLPQSTLIGVVAVILRDLRKQAAGADGERDRHGA